MTLRDLAEESLELLKGVLKNTLYKAYSFIRSPFP